jgi:hypothetical protein
MVDANASMSGFCDDGDIAGEGLPYTLVPKVGAVDDRCKEFLPRMDRDGGFAPVRLSDPFGLTLLVRNPHKKLSLISNCVLMHRVVYQGNVGSSSSAQVIAVSYPHNYNGRGVCHSQCRRSS